MKLSLKPLALLLAYGVAHIALAQGYDAAFGHPSAQPNALQTNIASR